MKMAKASQKSTTQEDDFPPEDFLFRLLWVEEVLAGVLLPVPLRTATVT